MVALDPALAQAGVADSKSLLKLVADERARFEGPATTEVVAQDEHDSDARIVAA